MAGELNTEVHDDPSSCQATADWLSQIQPGVSQIGDSLHRQRSESEWFWQGTAGDVCRTSMQTLGKDGDAAEQLIEQVKRALTAFAGTMDQVRSRIDQARGVAQDAKLIVTPTAILPPGPGPGPSPSPLPSGPVLPDAQAKHDAASQAHAGAVAEHAAKQKAFDEAKATVEIARDQQRQAHEALDQAMEDPLATIKTMKTVATYAVTTPLSYVGGAHNTSTSWFQHADRLDEAATTRQAQAAQTASPAMRELFEKGSERGTQWAKNARTNGTRALGAAKTIPEGARSVIGANPAGLVKSGSMVGKVSKGLLRGVPFVGTAASVVSGVGDVMMGKDAGDAAKDTGANIAGGAVGGWAGAAIGTACCPVIGTAIGGVVGGIAGSLGATSGVDALTD